MHPVPPEHAAFLDALERGPALRDAVLAQADQPLTDAYDRCVAALVAFRKLHFELAYTYVRKWDARKDDEIQGTGGTVRRRDRSPRLSRTVVDASTL
jgi:hypothetical protein